MEPTYPPEIGNLDGFPNQVQTSGSTSLQSEYPSYYKEPASAELTGKSFKKQACHFKKYNFVESVSNEATCASERDEAVWPSNPSEGTAGRHHCRHCNCPDRNSAYKFPETEPDSAQFIRLQGLYALLLRIKVTWHILMHRLAWITVQAMQRGGEHAIFPDRPIFNFTPAYVRALVEHFNSLRELVFYARFHASTALPLCDAVEMDEWGSRERRAKYQHCAQWWRTRINFILRDTRVRTDVSDDEEAFRAHYAMCNDKATLDRDTVVLAEHINERLLELVRSISF